MGYNDDFDDGSGPGFRQRSGQKQKTKLTQKQKQEQRQKARRVATAHARNMAMERSAFELAEIMDGYLKVMGLKGLRSYQEFNEDWERMNFDDLHDETRDPSAYRDKADTAALLKAQLEKLSSGTEVDGDALETILLNLHGLNMEDD